MLRPFAHHVACCWMLLGVVAQSLKPVKLDKESAKQQTYRNSIKSASQAGISFKV